VIIQPLEDNDLEHVEVKKEQDESPSGIDRKKKFLTS
jgi:hypothetical protein